MFRQTNAAVANRGMPLMKSVGHGGHIGFENKSKRGSWSTHLRSAFNSPLMRIVVMRASAHIQLSIHPDAARKQEYRYE
jgi:hypothetical protein